MLYLLSELIAGWLFALAFLVVFLIGLVGAIAVLIWCWDHWKMLVAAVLAIALPWRQ